MPKKTLTKKGRSKSRSKSPSRKSRSKSPGRPRKVVSAAKKKVGKKAFKHIKPWLTALKAYVKDHTDAKKGSYEYGVFFKKTLKKAKRGSKTYKEIKKYMEK